MTVGFHSPLPPAKTGIADYSAALIPALEQRGRVVVNSPGALINIYQLGNNRLHREIYEQALERPGIAVLHDALLQHYFLSVLDPDAYVAEFTYNYGAWTEDLARKLWKEHARSATDPRFFDYPMLKRIAERSLAVIVHNPAAAAMVAAHAPEAQIREIPHLFHAGERPSTNEVRLLRSRMGVHSGTFLFGVFGYLRESKRIASTLRAFEQVRERLPVALLVAGEFVSRDLAYSLEDRLRGPGVIRTGHLSERDFELHANAVDACINLRYPAAGETSGIAVRLMGLGKAVVLTAGCETSRFPESACLRIDTGPSEEQMLAEVMAWLASNPEDAQATGRRAAAYIQSMHSLERVRDMYWDCIKDCYDRATHTRG